VQSTSDRPHRLRQEICRVPSTLSWHTESSNAMLYNALSVGKKTPNTAPSPWDCVTPLEEDRATVIGNAHKNLVKIEYIFGNDILSSSSYFSLLSQLSYTTFTRHTHTQTDGHTDALITVLRHRSGVRSNNLWNEYIYGPTKILRRC